MIGAQFGLVALIPAMLNLTVVSAGQTIAVRICTGDGLVHTVQMPIGDAGGSGGKVLCCAKGCHSGSSRKRAAAKS